MIDFKVLMKLLHSIVPTLFAFSFYVCGYIVRENELISAVFMLIGTVWMVVSKLDDILNKPQHKVIVTVQNPPDITSHVEVNGKPIH